MKSIVGTLTQDAKQRLSNVLSAITTKYSRNEMCEDMESQDMAFILMSRRE